MSPNTNWPPTYIDWRTGDEHDWDASTPYDEEDGGYCGPCCPSSYRDLAYDEAAELGMEIGEYLDFYVARLNEWTEGEG
jgi:hypothetical protein